ncbi:SRPBCC family protein [Leptospira idonii]|uniref:Transcriptional regulator n=1 Tax=Leptospira idonii TaxID=1193500 RepID=A0A4R9M169_9LEPT|nr:SRPBCC family protein [Leptospira idonii]TGN19565.1 transcriptional regulator [Leptospira idonii]
MKFLKYFLIGLTALIVLCLSAGIFLPTEMTLSRTIVVIAPQDKIFDLINDLEKAQLWSPWRSQDPDMKITFGEKKAGLGAVYHWESETLEAGSMTITKSLPFSEIQAHLDFGEMGQAESGFYLKPDGKGGVAVTWDYRGKAESYFDRYFGLVIDALLGPDYEKGLSKLKAVAEE